VYSTSTSPLATLHSTPLPSPGTEAVASTDVAPRRPRRRKRTLKSARHRHTRSADMHAAAAAGVSGRLVNSTGHGVWTALLGALGPSDSDLGLQNSEADQLVAAHAPDKMQERNRGRIVNCQRPFFFSWTAGMISSGRYRMANQKHVVLPSYCCSPSLSA
jgi:hypothetical protein